MQKISSVPLSNTDPRGYTSSKYSNPRVFLFVMTTKQQARPAVEGPNRPVVETRPWPSQLEHRKRLQALVELYGVTDLAPMFGWQPEKLERKLTYLDREPQTIYSDLKLLKRIDAVIDVTQALEGVLDQDGIRTIVFEPREELGGRSLGEFTAGERWMEAAGEARQIAETLGEPS